MAEDSPNICYVKEGITTPPHMTITPTGGGHPHGHYPS